MSDAVAWIKRHQVVLAGLLLVAASLAWKAQFLYSRYLYQDDFVDLYIARRSPFSWHYLSLVGDDHFFPGLRAITWVLARVSVYNWGLDSTVLLAFAASASLAALRVLRTLFGERPAILLPLIIYLLLPLTIPDLGWWWTGMESQPFQLAIFMTLNAHVLYVRSGRGRHLIAALSWLTFGLLFFEKAVVLPLLLFAITSGFLVDAKSWIAGAARTLRQHWRAWLSYIVLVSVFAVVILDAFRTSKATPHVSSSISDVHTFVSYFVRDNLLPGIFGGPWHWLLAGPGSRYAIALPSAAMVTTSEVAALALLVFSIWIRPVAWRAWVIFAVWVVLADMLTIIFGRLGFGLTVLFALETRYLADAVPVLAVCFGLACLPVAAVGAQAAAQRRRRRLPGRIDLRPAAVALVVLFMVSAIWSDQTYQNITNGAPVAAAYIANADRAVTHATGDTYVLDQLMPEGMIVSPGIFPSEFGTYAYQSKVIGYLATGQQARRLHWIKQAVGTIDGLKMFGDDGRLDPTVMSGVYSVGRKGVGFKACWPDRHGQIVVKFSRATPPDQQTLQINYIWEIGPGFLMVHYGDSAQRLFLKPGLHSAYLQVTGAVTSFAIDGRMASHLCVGVVASGHLVPY